MATRKNIEHLMRYVGGDWNVKDKDNRKTFALIGFPDENGDYSISVVRCKDRLDCIAKAMRHYGTFTDKEIKEVAGMDKGMQILFPDNAIVVRMS